MLASVTPQSGEYWLEFRKRCKMVTASNVGSVFHANKYKSKRMLAKEMITDPDTIPKRFETDAMRKGKEMEETALEDCLEVLACAGCLKSSSCILRPGCIPALDGSPIACSPDALVVQGDDFFGIEVKTCAGEKSFPPKREDLITSSYLFQVFISLHILQADFWCLFYSRYDEPEGSCLYIFYPNKELYESLKQEVISFLNDADKIARQYIRKTTKDSEREEELRKRILENCDCVYV